MAYAPKGSTLPDVLFSTTEVMLNRIEAYAMLGEYERAIDNLLVYLAAQYEERLSCPRTAYMQTSSENYQDLYSILWNEYQPVGTGENYFRL